MTVYSLVKAGLWQSPACPVGQQTNRASSSLASNIEEQGGRGLRQTPSGSAEWGPWVLLAVGAWGRGSWAKQDSGAVSTVVGLSTRGSLQAFLSLSIALYSGSCRPEGKVTEGPTSDAWPGALVGPSPGALGLPVSMQGAERSGVAPGPGWRSPSPSTVCEVRAAVSSGIWPRGARGR